MSLFFRIYEHVLPRAQAWRVVIEKQLRDFFEGLTGAPEDYKSWLDMIWLDIFPETTREIPEWENQWGILPGNNDETTRKQNLVSAWQAAGGQSPGYIQDTLRNAGFTNVYVYDPWFFALGDNDAIMCGDPLALCGEPDALCGNPGTIRKFIRNPNTYITDPLTPPLYIVECGEPDALCGETDVFCGDTTSIPGKLLVNKIIASQIFYIDAILCGEPIAQCGEPDAICGENDGFDFVLKQYIIPDDEDTWPYFWYISGENFGDIIDIDASRKNEFETLILKIKPTHTWVGLLVNYT